MLSNADTSASNSFRESRTSESFQGKPCASHASARRARSAVRLRPASPGSRLRRSAADRPVPASRRPGPGRSRPSHGPARHRTPSERCPARRRAGQGPVRSPPQPANPASSHCDRHPASRRRRGRCHGTMLHGLPSRRALPDPNGRDPGRNRSDRDRDRTTGCRRDPAANCVRTPTPPRPTSLGWARASERPMVRWSRVPEDRKSAGRTTRQAAARITSASRRVARYHRPCSAVAFRPAP